MIQRNHYYPLLIGAAFLMSLPLAAQAQNAVPQSIIVRTSTENDIEGVDDDYGTSHDGQISGLPVYRLHVPDGTNTNDVLTMLQSDIRVAYAEPETYVEVGEVNGTNFHMAFDAGGLPGEYMNQTAYTQVNYGPRAETDGGAGITVAVLDTGATLTHPFLQNYYVPGYNAIAPGQSPDDLPDGITNAAVGHGTMVAGIVARLANRVHIMPIRVLNGDGTGKLFDVLAGIRYAALSGAKVLNMSFGSSTYSAAMRDAISAAQDAEILVVASAGNDGLNELHYPAAYLDVMAVASVEENGVKSPYSNYGSYIGISAPGSNIRSAYWTGGYANWSGTSFAAPFVSAEAAQLFGATPTSSAGRVFERIQSSAASLTAQNGSLAQLLGAGLLSFEDSLKNSVTAPTGTMKGSVTLEGLSASAAPQTAMFTLRSNDGSPDLFRTVSLTTKGVYTLTGLPRKTVTVHVTGDKWLAANVSANLTNGSASNVNATLFAGDTNGDNRVDFDDFLTLLNAFGSNVSDPASGYDATADLNADGDVDFDDFLLLLNHYDEQGDI